MHLSVWTLHLLSESRPLVHHSNSSNNKNNTKVSVKIHTWAALVALLVTYGLYPAVFSLSRHLNQALHPNYHQPGNSVDPHVCFPPGSCADKLTWPSCSPPFCTPTHPPNNSLSNFALTCFSTTWGQHRAKQRLPLCAHGRWLSITRWKFKFNICIRLILLNWFLSLRFTNANGMQMCLCWKAQA